MRCPRIRLSVRWMMVAVAVAAFAAARRLAYYDRLQRKYERAERLPWLPVAPDPPRP